MTHILASFSAIDAGAQGQRLGAASLRDSGDMNVTRFRNSGDYWADQSNVEMNATGAQWWSWNDASAEEADRRGVAMNVCNADYQGCLQQSIGIVSRLG